MAGERAPRVSLLAWVCALHKPRPLIIMKKVCLFAPIVSQAEYVKVLEPEYSKASYQERNEWMVSHGSKVIAVYNGQPGGTRNTIRHARLCRVPVLFLPG